MFDVRRVGVRVGGSGASFPARDGDVLSAIDTTCSGGQKWPRYPGASWDGDPVLPARIMDDLGE